MKTRLLSIVLVLAAGVAMATSSIAFAFQQPAPKTAEKAPVEKKVVKKKKKPSAKGGVPKGVQACLDRLIQIASADPLPAYEGQPEKIVNEGLMWNDPKSNCSIGSDQALRSKVADMANAWRAKNAERVRSLLQEIKSAAPAG